MSYSGGLRYGYAELMQANGIPLYPGVGPETGFKYRCKFRPHGRSGGRIVPVIRYDGFVKWRDIRALDVLHVTRAQAAQAVWEEGRDGS